MNIEQNKSLVSNARELRKNMTKEEGKLWFFGLRNYPVKFRRQQIVGNYIVDFYCHKAKLVIEIDGSQHYEPDNKLKDEQRTQYIEAQGIKVIRFSNLEVNKYFDAVCRAIHEAVNERIEAQPPQSRLKP